MSFEALQFFILVKPNLPIFFLRDINKRIVVTIADIELANARPPMPIIFDNVTDKIIFITTETVAFLTGVFVSCNE